MIKTLLINPITKETTEAFVDTRSLKQLHEFNGTGGFSIPLVLANGDSLIWKAENLLKEDSNYFSKAKEKVINSAFFSKSQRKFLKLFM
jgi:hypothetical protein